MTRKFSTAPLSDLWIQYGLRSPDFSDNEYAEDLTDVHNQVCRYMENNLVVQWHFMHKNPRFSYPVIAETVVGAERVLTLSSRADRLTKEVMRSGRFS